MQFWCTRSTSTSPPTLNLFLFLVSNHCYRRQIMSHFLIWFKITFSTEFSPIVRFIEIILIKIETINSVNSEVDNKCWAADENVEFAFWNNGIRKTIKAYHTILWPTFLVSTSFTNYRFCTSVNQYIILVVDRWEQEIMTYTSFWLFILNQMRFWKPTKLLINLAILFWILENVDLILSNGVLGFIVHQFSIIRIELRFTDSFGIR